MIGSMVKLIDYGSARRISAKQGEVGEMVGTTEFMCKFVSLCACSFFLSEESLLLFNFIKVQRKHGECDLYHWLF